MRCGIFLGLFAVAVLRAEPLTVHEWGTFTVLQDETGAALAGINTDDEPVPDFVWRRGLSVQTARVNGLEIRGKSVSVEVQGKTVAVCHPDVRMRLETPVVYFYPTPGTSPVVDVKVALRGGWLTEYFPEAIFFAPGLDQNRLDPETSGTLEWKNVKIGGTEAGPETDSKVWLAPRAVDAASVAMPNGEKERYLFYRGVANLDSPLRVRREGERLVVEPGQGIQPGEMVRQAWLADLRADGTAAFRVVDVEKQTEAHFSPEEYTRENAARLRESMHEGLVADGLFPKEATAMLNTWQQSYFQSPGLRLFFLVPRKWTDRQLPISFSVPVQISRVMMGRIEIVTPAQRRYLGLLAKDGREIRYDDPPAAYFLLGRFAGALVLDELHRHPTASLKKFAQIFRLE